MREMRRFVYFGRVPTNVCFNGVSFPIMPGDVLKCYPEFIAGFISPKFYKELAADDKKTPKFTFPSTPMILRPDPTKGLPMRSDPKAGPRLKDNPRYRMAAIEEVPVNPYERVEGGAESVLPVVETPKLEISTKPQEVVLSPSNVDAVVTEEYQLEEEPVEVVEETVVAPEEVVPVVTVTKTELRKATRDEIYARMVEVRGGGCPLVPEMLGKFNAFTEEATRGEMFAALWEYYGFDKE